MSPQDLWVCPHTDTGLERLQGEVPKGAAVTAGVKNQQLFTLQSQLIDFHSFSPQPTVSGPTSCVAACCFSDIVL